MPPNTIPRPPKPARALPSARDATLESLQPSLRRRRPSLDWPFRRLYRANGPHPSLLGAATYPIQPPASSCRAWSPHFAAFRLGFAIFFAPSRTLHGLARSLTGLPTCLSSLHIHHLRAHCALASRKATLVKGAWLASPKALALAPLPPSNSRLAAALAHLPYY